MEIVLPLFEDAVGLAPCARHCKSTAYEIEIRQFKSQLATDNNKLDAGKVAKVPPKVLQEPARIEFRINAGEYWTVVPASMSELPEFIEKMPGYEIRYLYAHPVAQVLPQAGNAKALKDSKMLAYLESKCETWIADYVATLKFKLDRLAASANLRNSAPVAYYDPKSETFCLPPKDGSRPFASAWKPLYADPVAQVLPETMQGE